MLNKSSLSSFFSSNVKVFASIILLYFLSWFFSLKPAINQYREARRQELSMERLMFSVRESKRTAESYPFITSRSVLSNRDESLLRILDQNRIEFGYKIISIEPYTFSSRRGMLVISTKVTLEGSYVSFIKIFDLIKHNPEIGKVSSVKIFTIEDRITKKKKLYSDIIIQIMAEQ